MPPDRPLVGEKIDVRKQRFGVIVERVGLRITRVAFSPDGQLIAGLNGQGVQVWDTRTGKPHCIFRELPVTMLKMDLHTLATELVFSPDGKQLATGGPNSRLALWDVTTGKEMLPRLGEEAPVACLTFGISPRHGRLLALAYDERREVEIWHASSGKLLFTLRGHRGSVRALAFNPSGTRLASAGDDHSIRLWNTSLGQEVLALRTETVAADLSFSPAGKRLAAVSSWLHERGWVWETAPIGVGVKSRGSDE